MASLAFILLLGKQDLPHHTLCLGMMNLIHEMNADRPKPVSTFQSPALSDGAGVEAVVS